MLGACGEKHRAELVDSDAPVRVRVATPTGDAVVTVELADTKSSIGKGLADRESLPADTGMLFFMGAEKDWSFWMANTLIPLDIIFITKDLRIAGIVHDAQPRTRESRYVGKPSTYVLEVHGGWSKRNNVAAGQRVTFDNIKL